MSQSIKNFSIFKKDKKQDNHPDYSISAKVQKDNVDEYRALGTERKYFKYQNSIKMKEIEALQNAADSLHFTATLSAFTREGLQPIRAHLFPKLRCKFAEFLLLSSLKRLRIFILPTCVGLRYGQSQTGA